MKDETVQDETVQDECGDSSDGAGGSAGVQDDGGGSRYVEAMDTDAGGSEGVQERGGDSSKVVDEGGDSS